jgi:NADH-quinone oxidoreductase subunit M
MGAVAMFFIIASLGMPGLGNFVGEFLILLGAFSVNKTIAVIATMGLITGAVYGLIAMQRVFQGQKSSDPEISGIKFGDFGSREMAAMIPMIIALTWIGVYPQPVFDLVDPVLASLYELTLGTSSQWIGASQ